MVDLEQLKRHLSAWEAGSTVPTNREYLLALIAVVEAAQKLLRDGEVSFAGEEALRTALQPFTKGEQR